MNENGTKEVLTMSLQAWRLLRNSRQNHLKTMTAKSMAQPARRNVAMQLAQFPDHVQVSETEAAGMRVLKLIHERAAAHIVLIHGGGFSVQGVQGHRQLMLELGKHANVDYLDYPLSPEADAEMMINAVVAALTDLMSLSNQSPFYVVADSSGANVALNALIRLRDAGGPRPTKTVLISPFVDLMLDDPAIVSREADDVFLSLPALQQVSQRYAGGRALNDPVINPMYDDLSHLGEFLVTVGGNELLLPMTTQLVQRLKAAGNDVTYKEYAEVIHDYVLWSELPETKRTIELMLRFFKL